MDMYRSINCSLLRKVKRCSFCARLRKTLIQKKSRFSKRQKCKRLTGVFNPYDQAKLSLMRKKLSIKRRQKNRRKIQNQVLLKFLRQKQEEFATIKEELFEEQCVKLNVSENSIARNNHNCK